MVVVQIITDNREPFREYHKEVPWFGTAPDALIQGFAQLPGVQIHVIGCTQRPMKSPDKLAGNIWFHSLHVPKIGWMRTGYQGCIRAVRKKIQQINPDIVHGQGTERECALSAIFSGFPNVLTVHGNMRLIAKVNKARPFSYQWLAAKLEAFTIPRSGGVVCITRYTQQAMEKFAPRTWVVPNAVDDSFFSVSRASESPPAILCVGAISFRKNQNNFICSLDSLAASRKIRVVFLGMAGQTDPYSAEFFQLLKTRPWCAYEGFATREKLKGYLSSATLLALPSLEDNCPMVVLEAMAAGVPVLAAKVGGVPDLIEDGITGWFCDPLDAVTIATGVAKILDDPAKNEEITRNAKLSASKRFHPAVVAEEHLRIYREVLKTDS
ncbi:MAG: glycosyltransferase family 4 protein [Verrucomicrobiota bacterium]